MTGAAHAFHWNHVQPVVGVDQIGVDGRVDSIDDVGDLRELLWKEVPGSRTEITALEKRSAEHAAEYGGEPFIGEYQLISEVFWWEVFEPALRSDDRRVIDQCLGVMEILLTRSSHLVHEAVLIRVVRHLKKFPEVREHAGDALIAALDQE